MTEREQLQEELKKQNENFTFYQNKIVELTNQKDITHSRINDYIGCVKITQSQIKQLEDKLKALPEQRWKPSMGEKYYYFSPMWKCGTNYSVWHNDDDDNATFSNTPIFATEAECAEDNKRNSFKRQYESMSDVTDEMWKNTNVIKYFANWNYANNKIGYFLYCNSKLEGSAFTTESACKSAISAIGESDFIKYVLNIRR